MIGDRNKATDPQGPLAQNVPTEPLPLPHGIRKSGPADRPNTKPGPTTTKDVQG